MLFPTSPLAEGDTRRWTNLSRTMYLLVALAIAAALVGWQLFVPPIIGLADQGDFLRLLGPLGYAPVPKGEEHKYWYLTRTFAEDPSYREPRWEQITSELIFAHIAVMGNRLFGNPKSFDLTLFGLTHLILFLLALARLLFVTQNLACYPLIWAFMLLVLTDAGYVAYWNSLYTEPASCIWFLFLVAESIALCQAHRISCWAVIRWILLAVLWIAAKAQNAPLCLPLGAYALGIAWRATDRQTRYVALAGIAAVSLSGFGMYRSIPQTARVTALYNAIFFGILPESQDPRADLRDLGLNPDYARYSSTVAWSPGTGVADGALVNALLTDVGPFKLVAFYWQRPDRIKQRLDVLFPAVLSLRPEFCGNYEQSAGHLPGARSDGIAFWSRVHEHGLPRIIHLLGALLALAVLYGVFWPLLNRGGSDAGRRWLELGACLAACCWIAFLVPAFGDAWDNVKHHFLFNLLLDACLLFAFASVLQILSAHASTGRDKTLTERW